MTHRVVLIYRWAQQSDRWFKGDHRWRAPIRRLIRGPDPIGGIDYVFLNLCAGLQRLGADYVANPPMAEIRADDLVGVIGRGRESLTGYRAENPIVTGVAVAGHPAEWPTLFEDYPVACNLVHCDWVKAMYDPWYGAERVRTWPVGIDTDLWAPAPAKEKAIDFLVYDKIHWDAEQVQGALRAPLIAELEQRGLTYAIIRYGTYKPADLKRQLRRARCLLFLCEHETQGLAYQQAMSAGLPVLAWNPGQWLDPWRYRYGETFVPATSVPFFDERCGRTFCGVPDFKDELDQFMDEWRSGRYAPREYVLKHLTLSQCAQRYLDILEEMNA